MKLFRRVRRGELPQLLHGESCSLVEHPVYLGACERLAVRLVATRVPEAVVNERRRKTRANTQKRGYTPSQTPLALMAMSLVRSGHLPLSARPTLKLDFGHL